MVATVSLSGATLGDKCEAVITAMRTLGICGDVTANVSVDPGGNLEPGCRVLIASKPNDRHVRRLWEHLRERTLLNCAHVRVEECKSGCYYDVYGASRCPSALDEE